MRVESLKVSNMFSLVFRAADPAIRRSEFRPRLKAHRQHAQQNKDDTPARAPSDQETQLTHRTAGSVHHATAAATSSCHSSKLIRQPALLIAAFAASACVL